MDEILGILNDWFRNDKISRKERDEAKALIEDLIKKVVENTRLFQNARSFVDDRY